MKCPNCSSQDIIIKIPVVDPFWGTGIGPKYRKNGGKILHTAMTYYDFCGSCGLVLKTYVDLPEDAQWVHGKGALDNE